MIFGDISNGWFPQDELSDVFHVLFCRCYIQNCECLEKGRTRKVSGPVNKAATRKATIATVSERATRKICRRP